MIFLCVLLFLAVTYVRPGELIPSLEGIPVLDLLSILSLAAGAVSLILRPRKFWNQPHDRFFLGYFAIIVLSNPLSGYFGIVQLAFMRFAPVAFTYFLIRAGVDSVERIRTAMRVLLWLTVLLAINGLLQIYSGASIGGVQAASTREGARIVGTGIFADPNDLGLAMVIVMPFALSIVLGRAGTFSRLVNAVAIAILLLASYHTNSRGTILGLGVVFSIFAFRRFGRFTAGALSTLGLLVIILFGPSRAGQISSDDASSQGRIQAWAAAVQMFKESPIWGVGWNQFTAHHERAAHNSFMHALGELGIIGAAMLVGMFYWYFVGLRLRPLPTQPGSDQDRAKPPPRMNGGVGAVRRMPLPGNGHRNEPDPVEQHELARRVSRDLWDCAIGILVCTAFLSRQYTVVIFIPLALAASFAATQRLGQPVRENSFFRHAMAIPTITVAGVAAFYIAVRVLAIYG